VKTYFDTSLLVKSYVEEETSPQADALLAAASPPVAFTELHGLEIRTALRLKHFRGELTAAELAGALQTLQDDLAAGLLAKPALDLAAMFHRAEALSARHVAATGARSLDILHVAAAVELGADSFASFDERQRAVAHKAGLKLLPKTLPVRGKK
jgi:predicted nucleic acid-binding protein